MSNKMHFNGRVGIDFLNVKKLIVNCDGTDLEINLPNSCSVSITVNTNPTNDTEETEPPPCSCWMDIH